MRLEDATPHPSRVRAPLACSRRLSATVGRYGFKPAERAAGVLARGLSLIRVGSYWSLCNGSCADATERAELQPVLQPAVLIPGGDLMDPEGPIPVPTPEDEAAGAVMQWLHENPRPNAGSVRLLADHKTVVVYWKGDPPAELKRFVAGQPVPVTIREAVYSRAELVAAARELVAANPGVVSSAGPNDDFSGVGITLSSKAPQAALAAVRAQSAVPIEFRGVRDISSRPRKRPPSGPSAAR